MERVNVYGSIFKDERFWQLRFQLNSKIMAIGCCVTAWSLAQDAFLRSPHRTVPFAEWEKSGIPEAFITVGLARRVEAGIYVAGTSDHCAFLLKRQYAGKVGGLKSKGKISSKTKQTKQTQANEASYSYSYSNSYSDSKEKKRESESTPPVLSEPTESHPTDVGLPLLARIWNEESKSLPKVKGTNTSRDRASLARLREVSDPNYWRDIVRRIEASPFCRGNNERGWRASYDWILRPETHLKVIEGKYDRPPDEVGHSGGMRYVKAEVQDG